MKHPKNIISSTTTWKITKYIVLAWFTFGFFYVQYFTVTGLFILFNSTMKNTYFAQMYFTMVSCASYTISMYFLLIKRRKIMDLVEDSLDVVHSINVRKYEMIFKRLKIYVAVVLVYSILISVLGVLGASRCEIPHSDLPYRMYTFGLNGTFVPRWVHESLVRSAYVMYSFTPMGYSVFLALGFTVFVKLISIIVDDLKTSMPEIRVTNEFGFNSMSNWRKIHLRVCDLIDRTNNIFENFLFIWYSLTLISTCSNITNFIVQMSHLDFVSLFYYFFVNFQDLFNLTFVTLTAAKVPETMDCIVEEIPSLADKAYEFGKDKDVHLMYEALVARNFGLKIGGCFVITKSLFLSFLGLGVTYAVVGIQLFPDMIKGYSRVNVTCA